MPVNMWSGSDERVVTWDEKETKARVVVVESSRENSRNTTSGDDDDEECGATMVMKFDGMNR
jgi:hypothetical protein